MSHLPSGTLPALGNDIAVWFFTVHVGLVVYASADAVLGMAITIKGRGNVTDSPSMRPECKVEPGAVGSGLHGGCDVPIPSAGGSSHQENACCRRAPRVAFWVTSQLQVFQVEQIIPPEPQGVGGG